MLNFPERGFVTLSVSALTIKLTQAHASPNTHSKQAKVAIINVFKNTLIKLLHILYIYIKTDLTSLTPYSVYTNYITKQQITGSALY